MVNLIISLQPRTGGGGGKSSDEIVGEAADDLAARLPKQLNVKDAGEATFARLNGDASIVSFVEEGTARLEPSGDTYDARQRLLYTADGSTDGVRVYFDEHIGTRDDTSSVVKGARFFHDIQFDDAIDLGPFLHPCGPDMYRGKLAFDGESKFRLLWSVSGPRKLGVVTSTFCRLS